MKQSKRTTGERVMLAFLLVLILGIGYYLGFYGPLQRELASISAQANETDGQILTARAKIDRMEAMRQELNQILSRPAAELTEIAPYDNKEAVLNHLSGILSQTQNYSLHFTDPEVQKDGTVRRTISMTFRCADYAAAKAVIRGLTSSRWRCLVSSLSITGTSGNMLEDSITVTATVTFFEHTGL